MIIQDILLNKEGNLQFLLEDKYGLYYFRDNQLVKLAHSTKIANYRKFFKVQKHSEDTLEIKELYTIIYPSHKYRIIATNDYFYMNEITAIQLHSNQSKIEKISCEMFEGHIDKKTPYIKFKIKKGDELELYNIEKFLVNF